MAKQLNEQGEEIVDGKYSRRQLDELAKIVDENEKHPEDDETVYISENQEFHLFGDND